MDETMKVPESESGHPVSGSEIEVEVGASKPAVFAPNRDVKKVVVAVHGIGDQYSFATIQSVVNRFCVYYGEPAAVPLGNFHSGQPAYSLAAPYPEDPFKRFAFTEVYWAPISREIANEKHTLEEAKTWARTIVERLRLRWNQERKSQGWEGKRKDACHDEDFELAQQVLSEMIQTIAVAERLCFLADKAGLFTFDLRKLLDDYLGDVQVVAEFTKQREKILGTFAKLLEDIEKAYPEAEIYIVAHSEGTVVALLGLLQAFRAKNQPGWTQKVRGFMTLGSPIDKHLALWPELFGKGGPSQGLEKKQIEWRNYYDFGDPVGFELDSIREWIQAHNWNSVFHFEGTGKHDFGFTRYPFPGKAHVDYWTDQMVFDHFISEVVAAGEPPPAKRSGPKPAPVSLRDKQWISYVVPYVGVFALLFIAAFILYKTVTGAMGVEPSSGVIALRSTGLAALLYGITLAARIPRLTYSTFWRVTSLALAGLGAFLYRASVSGAEPKMIQDLTLPPGAVTLGLAFLVAVVAFVLSLKLPSWGLIPLMLSGAVAVSAYVIYYLYYHRPEDGPEGLVWPVVLATAGFLYLWWLAALVFDLVFIWHLYIRHSRLMGRINQVLGTYKERAGAVPPQPAEAPVGAVRLAGGA